ncbi:MAG: cell division protein ZipA C-terminal FtsZ-binding domain-containing protein [Legionella sp.]|nr:cell division protein ZipA C-terminal FtsZ-binding domain-containing protein [Legionella sp.]
MQANWSLILNVFLLIGVVVAIGRLMKARRQNFNTISSAPYQPTLGTVENKFFDDIIAVRKIQQDDLLLDIEEEMPVVDVVAAKTPALNVEVVDEIEPAEPVEKGEAGKSLMMFLLAKENRTLAGYELLQTLLAAGLRFGEGHLFHRHQHSNGQGPVLCSLAAATATGVFDLQNIGAFSVRGLCLFMQSSGNPTIDAERLTIMFETARQLSDDLDTRLLDEKQRPFTDESVQRYCRLLNIKDTAVPSLLAEPA